MPSTNLQDHELSVMSSAVKLLESLDNRDSQIRVAEYLSQRFLGVLDEFPMRPKAGKIAVSMKSGESGLRLVGVAVEHLAH